VNLCTENIIISGGGAPNYPTILAPLVPTATDKASRAPLFHTCNYITSVVPFLQTLSKRNAPLKLAVVGGGQSAAEVTLDLQRRLDGVPSASGQPHEIHMIIRKGCLKPSDDSPFVNEIFDPACTLSPSNSQFLHAELFRDTYAFPLYSHGQGLQPALDTPA
jgi:L-ornithine N5-oxygenase